MDLKQVVLQHFDKAIAGVAGIWLLISLAGFATKPAALSARTEMQADIDRITDYVKKRKPSKVDAPDWEQDVRKNLDSSGVGTVEAFPGWVLHRRPNIVYDFSDLPKTQDPVHKAPKDVSLRPERGRITVTWTASDENALVEAKEYEVLRKSKEDGDWESVGLVEGETEEYVDTNISPRLRYWYKIKSHAKLLKDHPIVRKAKMEELAEDLRVTESEEAGPVKTPRSTIVTILQVIMPTDDEILKNPDVTGKCHIKVWRYDADNAKKPWIYHRYNSVEVGTKIGAEQNKKGGKKVDFRVGGVLHEVTEEERENPKIKGHMIKVGIVKIKYDDGSIETVTTIDEPEELK